MPRLGPWIGLAVGCLSALPALAQQKAVDYGALEDIPVATLPLSLAVAGWEAPGFTHAARQRGTVQGEDQPSVTRYEGRFSHGAYFGRVLLIDTTRNVRWQAPTPQAVIREFGFFHGKPTSFGTTGSVTNGRMPIDYALVRVDEADPKSCATFTGVFERAQLKGFLCVAQDAPLADAAPRFIGAIGHPGVLAPVVATLPVLRATTAPGGQDIVAGAPLSPTPRAPSSRPTSPRRSPRRSPSTLRARSRGSARSPRRTRRSGARSSAAASRRARRACSTPSATTSCSITTP
ncbi:MAG: hypothetical protein HY060_14795 [Proteobacteria bacterium]|nr:hypothetical protein [Pseudomonadota bacterium]